jgi:dTDP-4-amino-4,6-dideoxygalactose transaminase
MTQRTIPIVKVGLPPATSLMPMLQEVLYSGMIAEGEQVYSFERRCAAQFSLPYVLAMSSGTAALHAALHFAGVRSGDAVISTPITAEPTNLAILHAGAELAWADVDPATGNMDPQSIEAVITPRTKAIIIVHYAGYPVDMPGIMAVAQRHGLAVIEDCAHAVGAISAGRPVGTYGDFAIFSFQAIKHMTTVDGGLLGYRNPELTADIKRFRWFGMDKGADRASLDVSTVGWKYNMTNVAATIGLSQLDVIADRIAAHVANGRYFDHAFSQMTHVRPASFSVDDTPSYWLYTLLCDDAEAVMEKLQKNGVMASKLGKRNDSHSLFAAARRPLPGVDEFSRRYTHLPVGWWVSADDRALIVDLVGELA